MLATLHTPYAETTAADLSFALDAARQPALYVRDLTRIGAGRMELQLRLLGASHQVVLSGHGDELIETVACLPGRTPDLPAVLTDESRGYRFRSRVLRLTPAEISARAAALRQALTENPYALIGIFPGDPDAITALRVGGTGAGSAVEWHTWHAYPQTGELVRTQTTVEVSR